MNIRTFVITLPENPQRKEKCIAHFKELAPPLHSYQFFDGLHAEKAGLSTVHPYEVDNPGTGFRIGYKPTGIFMSHFMLWTVLNYLHDDHFFIMEDDVKFSRGWHTRFTQALQDVPPGFDMLYVGSCCCQGQPQRQIKNEVWEVKWPQCTHAYIVAKKAIPTLLTMRKLWAPVDLGLIFDVFQKYPNFKVFAVLPRICDQHDTEIIP
jgi:GR25 family glycosyltransferase involved in LPS biosynthesis